MAYATIEDLAAALRVTVTPANTARLTECVDAAADETDHWLGRDPVLDPLPDPPPALVVRVNVARAVEHWKATDATFLAVGTADTTGTLMAPSDGFARYAADLTPFVSSFGVS